MATLIYGQTSAGQVVPVLVGADGSLISEPASAPWNYAGASGGIVNTTPVAIAPAAGAGLVNYLTSFSALNKSATTASEFTISDSVTGATLLLGWLPALMSTPAVFTFPTPLAGSPNSALQVTVTTTGTATYVNAGGYVDASTSALIALTQALSNIVDDYGNTIVDDYGNTVTLQ